MTVQTNTNVASFNGNGVTQIFPIAFKFNNDTDLVVLLVDDATGSASPLTLNSDYTVSGEGDEEGGLINVVVAPAIGKRLKVTRVVDILQLTDLRNQGKFFAEIHEDALDLLTMIAQQHESGMNSSLRVAESDPEPARIPAVAQRAGKILSFDANGNPQVVAPVADSSTELRQELANTTDVELGAAKIGRAAVAVASIAALLSAKQAADLQYEVRGYHAGTNYGGGAFYWDAARPKAEHDGGMIVDPARAFPASWSDAAQIATWYTPATSGSGCWVRVSDDYYPDHFGATYTTGQNQTPMIQQAENAAAKKNRPLRLRNQYHELQTQLQVRRAPQIVGDSGGVGSLRSWRLSNTRRMSGAVFVSKVTGALAVDIRPATYDFGGQIENLTLVGRYNPGEAKVAGDGIKLDEFGWSATVKNLTVEDFAGIGVEIGYLQDTTFDRLTVLGCGPTYAKASLVFSKNSNFLYFRDAHIEDGNYLMRSYASDANGAAWDIHWSGAHFEVGNYSGTPDPTLEHRYATPCVRFEGQHRQWTFDTCTFAPVGSSFLAAANGGTADSQPYFMLADDASGFKFSESSFNSPTTGIDPVNIASTAAWADEFGPNEFLNCTFRGLNPTKTTSPVKVDIGNIVGGTMHFYTGGASSILNGVQTVIGQIRGVTFVSAGDTTTKTGGRLIHGPAAGGLTVGENNYRLSRDPFIWLSKECALTDSRSLSIKTLSANVALNMELEKPGTTYQASAALTITDITNCQRGRRIRIFNTSGGTLTVAQTATLYPNGAGALTMAHLLALELVSDSNGVLMKV